MVELCGCEGQARGLIYAAVVRVDLGVSVLGSHAHAESGNDGAESWTFPSLIGPFCPGAFGKLIDVGRGNP